MTARARCPHCNAVAPKIYSRWLRGGVVVIAWTVAMSLVFGGIMLGPGIMIVLPIIIPAGMALVTEAQRWSYPDVVCEICGKAIALDGEVLQLVARAPGQTLAAKHELAA
jgi:hypothetical protein